MENQQSTRLARRANFQSLPLTQRGRFETAAGSSKTAADAHYERFLRIRYIETYLRLADESRQESPLKHSPRRVDFFDKFKSRPTWAGPNVERDMELFRQKHMAEPEPFDKNTSILKCMYGFALNELEFLARNPNAREREAQLETLELYHLLKFFLGTANVADLSEQLEFCFYALKRSRSAWMETPRGGFNPQAHQRRQRDAARDRRREFQIAKIMADRLWEQLLLEGQRIMPIFLRRQLLTNGQQREGDWQKLSLGEKFHLLGGEGQYYKQHGLHHQLAREWLSSPAVPDRPPVLEFEKPLESLIQYGPLLELSGDLSEFSGDISKLHDELSQLSGVLSELSCKAMSNFRLEVLQREVEDVPRHVKWLGPSP